MSGEPPEPEAQADAKRCRCGFARGHHWIRPEYDLGTWALLGMIFGVTAPPKRIDFRCGQCGDVVGSITDRAALRRWVRRT